MRNLSYAWRTLRRSPIFLVTAVVTLGLGVGATTAIFSLFYQVLLAELPVPRPDQLIVLHQTVGLPGWTSSDNFESAFSYPMYLHLRDGSGTPMQGLIARSGSSVTIERNGQADRVKSETVSGNFFQVLGILWKSSALFHPSFEACFPARHPGSISRFPCERSAIQDSQGSMIPPRTG